METATRNATLADMAAMLQEQHARKMDVVAGASAITASDGRLVITGTEPILTNDGVTLADGAYVPTAVCDEGIAAKLGIPTAYLRRMRSERPDLYDANVNGWLHGDDGLAWNADHERVFTRDREPVAPDPRSFLVRCFKGDDGEDGIARAFLSDRYKVMDNLDVLMSALQGIEEAGVNVVIDGCDLTDRRMYVKIVAPEVQVMAETLLAGYRNPFGDDFERWRQIADREGLGYGDGTEPVVFAGFVLTNSETGGGAFTIVPRAVVKVCKNGLTITRDMTRSVHLGGKLDEGIIEWSDDTQEKAAELVRASTRDAVRTFLSPEYLKTAVEGLEQKAAKPIATVDEVKVLTKPLRFTPEQMDGILGRFVQGGQMSLGGVVNAITAAAQLVPDADDAHRMEEQAVGLLA